MFGYSSNKKLKDDILEIKNSISDYEFNTYTDITEYKGTLNQGFFVNTNGNINDTINIQASSKYGYIEIDIEPNQKFLIASIVQETFSTVKLFFFLNSDSRLLNNCTLEINKSTLNNPLEVTSPDNAVKLIVNVYNDLGWTQNLTNFSVKRLLVNISSIVNKLNNYDNSLGEIPNILTDLLQIKKLNQGINISKNKLPVSFSNFIPFLDDVNIPNNSSIINGIYHNSKIFNAINPIFTYSTDVKIGENYPNWIKQDTPTNLGYVIDFYADTRFIELVGWNFNTTFNLVVDNQIVISEKKTVPNLGGNRYLKIDCLTKQKRHFRIFCYGIFGGVVLDENSTIEKFNYDLPELYTDGDSVIEGNGASTSEMPLYSYVGVVSQILNFKLTNVAIGGGGYVKTANGLQPNMVDRMSNNILSFNPAIFLASAGLNDLAQDLNILENNINLYWQNIKNGLSDTYIIAISPFNPNSELLTNMFEVSEFVRISALKNNIPYIDINSLKTYDSIGNLITDNSNGPNNTFITGTGTDANPTVPSDGNRSFYISDGTHLTREGHRKLGIYLSNEIYKILKLDLNYSLNNYIYR